MLLRAKVEEAKSQSVELRAEVSSSKAQGQEAVRTLRGQLQQAQAQIEQQGRESVSLTERKAAAIASGSAAAILSAMSCSRRARGGRRAPSARMGPR